MSDETFEAIKARNESGKAYAKSQGYALTQTHRDRDDLVRMVEAQRDLAHPTLQTDRLAPLVLYFENEADRQGFVAVVQDINPNWKTVKLP